ncbi:Spc97/Spc98 family protein [Ceratocystis lukuohia]|uniref:Spc97/Spc98 family protein n=1 Tax=Ceratocystis lukuohia TaxID=2019550 RepID=A0ABR4MU81_9PEZI
MADNKIESRITNAIDRLVSHLIPNDPDEDESIAQQRHDHCFNVTKTILSSPAASAPLGDVNHASDMIKRKLIQTNPSQALRFSNLYTRLLSLPVLNQKWAILYLLYQLSDSPDPNEPVPITPRPPPLNPRDVSRRQEKDRSPNASPLMRTDEEAQAQAQAAYVAAKEAQLAQAQAHVAKKQTQKEVAKKAAEAQRTPVEPEPPRRDVALKSLLLADNYSEITPSEVTILRDMPFTLQGVPSETLPITQDNVLKIPPTLPPPLVSLLNTLAEPSLLYRKLDTFVNTPAPGLLQQSIRAAISTELRSYLSLIATLEGQIRRALSSLDETAPRGGIGKAGVTLKRCVIWTREATMGLRLLSVIAEESTTKHGGELITLIHNFSSAHGDPTVAAFAERLLVNFTKPFYDILRHWIYDGELSDPYLEFFVKEQTQKPAAVDRNKSGGTSIWETKYEMVEAMIPSIITRPFAEKMFLIGKSLNFIRHSCGDSQWVEAYSKAASRELRYGETAKLEAWIDEAYKTTMKQLIDLMDHKFKIFMHLQALKDYMLLGQGDFTALLMESLAPNLDRPANILYRHTVTAQLDHAIKGSNAQYDNPEVLRRLDAHMLQRFHGDIGWDCFTLDYKIDAPVDVVVTEWGLRQYLKVFNLLWRIKRVEFALATTWRKCMTGARGVLQSSDSIVNQTWKSTQGILAEMIHFVGQLQYYFLFEVIESSWDELQRKIHRDGATLDDLINAHTQYLNDITHKGLLGANRNKHAGEAAAAAGASDGGDRTTYTAQLNDILKGMLTFRDSVDGLYSWSVSNFSRHQELGMHGDDEAADAAGLAGPASEFPVLQERLRHLGLYFKSRLQILLGDLAYQPDLDMRFLGVAMNFNDFYQPVKRRVKSVQQQQQGTSATSGGTKEGGGYVGGGK